MRFLTVLLIPLLVVNQVCAQIPAPHASTDSQTSLVLHVVEDPGPALPNSTSEKGFTVQVTDQTGAPVAGAAVAFRLPEQSPTGRFADGLRAWVAYTDAAGIIRFPVIHWGDSGGIVEIKLTAAKGSVHAGLLIQHEVQESAKADVVKPETGKQETIRQADNVMRGASIITLPSEETSVQLAEPKPAPPPAPLVALDNLPAEGVSQRLADTVPPKPAQISTNRGISAMAQLPHAPSSNPPSSSGANGASDKEPMVSITNSKTGGGAGSHKKWIIIAALGVGAGVGTMLALKGHGSGSSATSPTAVSIGAPTISVGH